MKRFLLSLVLLAPGAVLAEPCDMTPFKEIDQRYVAAAPACIESGDYTSAACAVIKDLTLEIFQASASVKALRCEDIPYETDPRLESLREQIFALRDAQMENEVQVENSSDAVPAKFDDGEIACTQVMHDIEQKYDFIDLKWVRNQVDVSRYFPIVPCSYEAIQPGVYGNTPVIIEVVLNVSNKRYRLKVH